MLKLTHLSTALAAVVIASALSGCGGGNVEPVSGPTTNSHVQATTDAEAKAATAGLDHTARQGGVVVREFRARGGQTSTHELVTGGLGV